jgi:hypothetical protein
MYENTLPSIPSSTSRRPSREGEVTPTLLSLDTGRLDEVIIPLPFWERARVRGVSRFR